MKQLTIAVGIICNAQQQILITRRAAGTHLAGFWEFPGGKVEPGESVEQALSRELQEEVGITPQQPTRLNVTEHQFDDRTVTLNFYLVNAWSGNAYNREGQQMCWVHRHQLSQYQFPAANQAVIELLQTAT
ncbi:8-oxo-dGTP diphosphatase MutT [Serratia microhaemolytica]|uniref:8-oxo-dGTP diphosphatase MutT n=1 Tax=Serratia microhaemolytica TaxID=2675110 RepID=UPI000FDE5172|nr:8-oxo-dGTP diphosphatase MutT [Serratia microhaemolytica]